MATCPKPDIIYTAYPSDPTQNNGRILRGTRPQKIQTIIGCALAHRAKKHRQTAPPAAGRNAVSLHTSLLHRHSRRAVKANPVTARQKPFTYTLSAQVNVNRQRKNKTPPRAPSPGGGGLGWGQQPTAKRQSTAQPENSVITACKTPNIIYIHIERFPVCKNTKPQPESLP